MSHGKSLAIRVSLPVWSEKDQHFNCSLKPQWHIHRCFPESKLMVSPRKQKQFMVRVFKAQSLPLCASWLGSLVLTCVCVPAGLQLVLWALDTGTLLATWPSIRVSTPAAAHSGHGRRYTLDSFPSQPCLPSSISAEDNKKTARTLSSTANVFHYYLFNLWSDWTSSFMKGPIKKKKI